MRSNDTEKKPTCFRTRRGNRVFRAPYHYGDETRYADNYTFRIKKAGKQHHFNLGTDKKKASTRADQIKTFLSAPNTEVENLYDNCAFDFLEKPAWHRPGLHGDGLKHIPTVGELIARYRDTATDLSPVTVANNCSSLRHVAAHVLELRRIPAREVTRKSEKWRRKVESLPLNRITRRHLEEMRLSLIRTAGTDQIKRGKAAITANSYLRAARSLFAERWLDFYEDFELPDPNPFKQIRPAREPSQRYVSAIDIADVVASAKSRWWDGVLDKKELEQHREAEKLAGKDGRYKSRKTESEIRVEERARFIIVLLAACGLRPKEIRHLLWDKVDFVERRIWIEVTLYDTPKARNSERPIDLGEEVAAILKKFRELTPASTFVVPGDVAGKKRADHIFRSLNKWLRETCIDDHRPLYILRKEAGSLIFQSTGSVDKAAEYLRNHPRVAYEHYIGRKERLELTIPGLAGNA